MARRIVFGKIRYMQEVSAVFLECLWRDGEDPNEAVSITSLTSPEKQEIFHAARLKEHKDKIRDLGSLVPAEYHDFQGETFQEALISAGLNEITAKAVPLIWLLTTILDQKQIFFNAGHYSWCDHPIPDVI